MASYELSSTFASYSTLLLENIKTERSDHKAVFKVVFLMVASRIQLIPYFYPFKRLLTKPQWIFWINLPISGLAFILIYFFLDVHNPKTPLLPGLKAVDWLGSISILGLMVMLLLGLDFGGATFPWNSPTVIGLLIAGFCMVFFFLLSEKRFAKYPLMPLGIFQSRSNVACLLIGFFSDYVSN